MNRKGEGQESSFENAQTIIFFTVMMFAITILVFTFIFLLNSYESGLTAVQGEFKAEVLSLRFITSPECFAYQDPETKRIFPGIIDLNKFNEKQMQACYKTNEQTGKDEMNFRLQLESTLDYSVKTNKYFNADKFTMAKSVIVRDKDQFKTDKLFIYVQEGLI